MKVEFGRGGSAYGAENEAPAIECVHACDRSFEVAVDEVDSWIARLGIFYQVPTGEFQRNSEARIIVAKMLSNSLALERWWVDRKIKV